MQPWVVRNIPERLWPVEESQQRQKQGEVEEHTKKNLIVEINLCVYDPCLLYNSLLHQRAGIECNLQLKQGELRIRRGWRQTFDLSLGKWWIGVYLSICLALCVCASPFTGITPVCVCPSWIDVLYIQSLRTLHLPTFLKSKHIFKNNHKPLGMTALLSFRNRNSNLPLPSLPLPFL